jgi:hypothetical protein
MIFKFVLIMIYLLHDFIFCIHIFLFIVFTLKRNYKQSVVVEKNEEKKSENHVGESVKPCSMTKNA